jgi:hypothetical protein
LVNQGTLFVRGGTSNFNGAFTNGANGLLQLRAGVTDTTNRTAVLNVANNLTNNGTIQITDIAGNSIAALNVTNGALTNGPGALLETLTGAGNTYTLNAQLDNQGTINISGRLNLSHTGAAHTNSGLITVRADLNVSQQGATASFDNTGTINVLTGNVTFTETGAEPSFANDGEIDIAPNRFFTLNGGRFSSYTNNTLGGGIYNIAGNFQFTDAKVLANAATLILDGGSAQILDQSGNTALSKLANNSGTLTFQNGRNFSWNVDFSNSGTLTVLGSTFTVNGTYTQTGGATVLGAKANLAVSGGMTIVGGVLSGSGTVTADVINAAELDVGASVAPGILTISGNYTQTADGILNIEIGGTLSSQFDQLVITKQATLDGTLNVRLINSFSPKPGTSFTILTFNNFTGKFATVTFDQAAVFALNSKNGTVTY